MTAAQERYLKRLFDQAQFTQAQRRAALVYRDVRFLLDLLAPPKDLPRSEHWRYTNRRGRELIAVMYVRSWSVPPDERAVEAVHEMRADDDTVDWEEIDDLLVAAATDKLPWTDDALDRAADADRERSFDAAEDDMHRLEGR